MSERKDFQTGALADNAATPPAEKPFMGRPHVTANDAYRNWITRVRPARLPEQPRGPKGNHRLGIDRSLYSFKAYQEWTRKVRRDLQDEE